jgi:hypothetical protein
VCQKNEDEKPNPTPLSGRNEIIMLIVETKPNAGEIELETSIHLMRQALFKALASSSKNITSAVESGGDVLAAIASARMVLKCVLNAGMISEEEFDNTDSLLATSIEENRKGVPWSDLLS